MTSWWVVFSERPGKNPGACLGIVLIDADTQPDALKECFRRKINPGGYPTFTPMEEWGRPARRWFGRCLSPTEAERLAAQMNQRISEAIALFAVGSVSFDGNGMHPAGSCWICVEPDYGFPVHLFPSQPPDRPDADT